MRSAIAASAVVFASVLTACGSGAPAPGTSPTASGPATVIHFTLDSHSVGRTLAEIGVEMPPLAGGGSRPLLVLLHGRGSSPARILSDGLLPALERAGASAPNVVLANGGDASYYHDRASGDWGTSVVDEVVPFAIRLLHADPSRVAIGGMSMGGFGALDIARLWPSRFCAVGGHSAAMWGTGGETPAGAFDDAQDFSRHDLFAAAAATPAPYRGMAVWLDVGSSDPFVATDTAFAHLLQADGDPVSFHQWPGGHNDLYWSRHMAEYVAFYARALAAC